MDLNYPVVHSEKKGITDVEVDWSTPWLSRTEYAIDSAYMSSPFFEYYRDELYAILDSQPRTLWDMNYRIIGFFCRKIGITPEIVPSSSFVREVDDDYRYLIHPKKKNTIMADRGLERPYWQVFNDRYGFTPGLSIMDLVFNEGPESICWLRK